MAKLQVTPASAFTEYKEINFQGLFMYHTPLGSKANQVEILDNKKPIGIGATAVSNWEVYDGPGENAKLVARAQGLHIQAGNWVDSLSLVFVDERFSGSTLEVMGIVVETGEWAVVGGTGQFAMANGVISKKFHEQRSDGNIIELTIRAFCPQLKGTRVVVPAPTKRGPWGGNGGSLREMEGKSQRLESVTINHGGVVHGIGFSYIDEEGRINNAGFWGEILTTLADKTETIKFGPSEFVKQITGTGVRGTAPLVYLAKFRIVTNQKTYGPFGTNDGDTSFIYTVPEGETVVGFFANTSDRVYKIGLYTI